MGLSKLGGWPILWALWTVAVARPQQCPCGSGSQTSQSLSSMPPYLLLSTLMPTGPSSCSCSNTGGCPGGTTPAPNTSGNVYMYSGDPSQNIPPPTASYPASYQQPPCGSPLCQAPQSYPTIYGCNPPTVPSCPVPQPPTCPTDPSPCPTPPPPTCPPTLPPYPSTVPPSSCCPTQPPSTCSPTQPPSTCSPTQPSSPSACSTNPSGTTQPSGYTDPQYYTASTQQSGYTDPPYTGYSFQCPLSQQPQSQSTGYLDPSYTTYSPQCPNQPQQQSPQTCQATDPSQNQPSPICYRGRNAGGSSNTCPLSSGTPTYSISSTSAMNNANLPGTLVFTDPCGKPSQVCTLTSNGTSYICCSTSEVSQPCACTTSTDPTTNPSQPQSCPSLQPTCPFQMPTQPPSQQTTCQMSTQQPSIPPGVPTQPPSCPSQQSTCPPQMPTQQPTCPSPMPTQPPSCPSQPSTCPPQMPTQQPTCPIQMPTQPPSCPSQQSTCPPQMPTQQPSCPPQTPTQPPSCPTLDPSCPSQTPTQSQSCSVQASSPSLTSSSPVDPSSGNGDTSYPGPGLAVNSGNGNGANRIFSCTNVLAGPSSSNPNASPYLLNNCGNGQGGNQVTSNCNVIMGGALLNNSGNGSGGNCVKSVCNFIGADPQQIAGNGALWSSLCNVFCGGGCQNCSSPYGNNGCPSFSFGDYLNNDPCSCNQDPCSNAQDTGYTDYCDTGSSCPSMTPIIICPGCPMCPQTTPC